MGLAPAGSNPPALRRFLAEMIFYAILWSAGCHNRNLGAGILL